MRQKLVKKRNLHAIRHFANGLGLSRFIRRATPDREGSVELTGRKIYILPTRYGLLFAALLGTMLLGSINSANNLGFMLTFLLTGVGIISIVHTWHNLLGVHIRANQGKPVFAGQMACFLIQLENQRSSPRPAIILEVAGKTMSAIDLESHATGELSLPLPAPKRGTFRPGQFTLSTCYPLGLLRAWSYINLDLSCTVYPKPGPHREQLHTPSYLPSATGDRGVGRDDFAGLRQFYQGDSPRHIDWKAAARGSGLKTKLFGGDSGEQRWLDWENLPGFDTEMRLSYLCRAVLLACESRDEYGLRLPGTIINPAHGAAHRHQCLAALAHFEAESSK